ncbi:MAG: HAD hydrolase-like protein [Marinilabiliaceae bacterium]|jgi:phosphoglycolate phosphatase-like HAD superfamily hydrolase|nr:HAD hydrolase-like protein [Marinilabiliaceae bacterium]
MNNRDRLQSIRKDKDFFVGIDSDGCVFDTMDLKQKEFFIPNGIKYFNLFAISREVRETWEFVNLHSDTRGTNRFPALVRVFELLGRRKDIREKGFELPDISSLEYWTEKESKLGNESLNEYIKNNADPFLSQVLEWSLAVNHDIATWLRGVSPFNYVKEALERISLVADSVVVSQTPAEALEKEWEEHGLSKFVKLIAGQEYGTKTEHIRYAATGRYAPENILMIGDAPGDLKAAKDNKACFFPVIPGKEAESWEILYKEALDRFLTNTYKGEYEAGLLRSFEMALPDQPIWEQL